MNYTRFIVVVLAALLVVPTALAGRVSEVRAEAVESPANGLTEGGLVALFIDQFVEDEPLPGDGFRLESPSATVIAHEAAHKARGIEVATEKRPLHHGRVLLEGVQAKAGLHLWATPSSADSPRASIEHAACTRIDTSESSSSTRTPAIDQNRGDIVVDTSQSIAVDSCTTMQLVLQGNFFIVLWEWDVELNGRHVSTGVNDTAGTGMGSARELVIEAHDATLTIPLTPDTHTLYLDNPRLMTRNLRILHAEGTIPGVLESVQGEDVELQGDYTASIASQGVGKSLQAIIGGMTHKATANGEILRVQVPEPTSDTSPGIAIAVLMGIVLAFLALGRFLWSTRNRHAPVSEVAKQAVPIPKTKGAAPMRRDAEAEQAVLRVVRRFPGVTVRRLQERASVAKPRSAAALEALLERGVLTRRGSEAKWHIFEPTANLDETWGRTVAMQDTNLRLALGLLEEYAGAEQRHIIAAARERWNWSPSTTKGRLLRLAAVDLAKATETVPRGTLSVTWSPAAPTEGK